MLCKSGSDYSTHTKVLCIHNSFGVGSANPSKHAPLTKKKPENTTLKAQKYLLKHTTIKDH